MDNIRTPMMYQRQRELHFVEPAHSVQVLTGLNSLRLARTFCDVTLCVDDQEFTCHKVALAAFSPYFRAMFTGDLAESQQDRVSLKGVDASTVRQLVDYAYTSEIDITETNVHSLLSAANLFDILPVRDACCTFLEKIMDGTNCLGIRCFAEAHACYDFQEKAKAFILRNFSEVAAQEEFLQITSTKLTELLSDDLLEVDCEEDVFEAVMRWYGHDPDTRGANFEKVLEQVKLPLISPYYLCDRVEMAPVVQQNQACRDLLEEAKTYHLLPDRRAKLSPARTRFRKLTGDNDVHTTVQKFDPRTETWLVVTPMPNARHGPAACVLNGHIFVIGGFNAGKDVTNKVESYDPNKDGWRARASMKERRCLPGVAVANGRIYVFGGVYVEDRYIRHCNTIECYDPDKDSWEVVGKMPYTHGGLRYAVLRIPKHRTRTN